MFGTLSSKEKRGLFPSLRKDSVLGLRDEFEDMLSRLWGNGENWLVNAAPNLDVTENDTSVEVRLDLPGMKPDDIDIQLSGNVLTVLGERKVEEEKKGTTYHRIERRVGAFSRSVTLPSSVNEEEVAAEYRDGVLVITMPKSEEAKARKIKVKS
ncbi:MAG: Hsp20/alpha crystallin family protein [Planctomycetes bacterium]|nr:Hsp20/alpha crystallin family protein [Planctomycetota bacterium]